MESVVVTDVVTAHIKRLSKVKDCIIMQAIEKHLGTSEFSIPELVGRMHAVTFGSALESGGLTQYSIDGVPILILTRDHLSSNGNEITCTFSYKILS